MGEVFLDFCPRLKRIIETGTSINRDGETVAIGGVSTLNNIMVIRKLLLQERPARTLEIGLAYGGSALTILSTLKEVSPDNFHHSAIDPFQNRHWGGSSLRVIEEEGFASHFTHYEGFSSAVLPELVQQEQKYELIYIDGSHIFEDVFVDFYYSASLLSVGGHMVLDDCTDRHVHKVIRFIRSNFRGIFEEIDYATVEPSSKSLKKRIGNALGIRQLTAFRKIANGPRAWDAKFEPF